MCEPDPECDSEVEEDEECLLWLLFSFVFFFLLVLGSVKTGEAGGEGRASSSSTKQRRASPTSFRQWK